MLTRISDMEKELECYRDEKRNQNRGKEEIMGLRMRLEELEKIIEKKNADISKMDQTIKDLQKQLEKIKSETTGFEGEKKNLLKELAEFKSSSVLSQVRNSFLLDSRPKLRPFLARCKEVECCLSRGEAKDFYS